MGKHRALGHGMVVGQAGVIPYRMRPDGMLQVMLVTNRIGGWIVPKGQLEPDLSDEESALKEAYEEAGVKGVVESPFAGHYEYEKLGQLWRVRLFPMRVTEVLESWPEMDSRTREWLSIDEAIRRVAYDGLRDVLEQFERRMAAG